MDPVDMIFDRMDRWRHLPSYQLERRADLLFSLYIPEVLEKVLGLPMLDKLVPEFPVRVGTIYPHILSDKSYKIDYLALSASRVLPVFVELKTESLSRRPTQDRYLIAAQCAGLSRLLEGVLGIFRATNAKRKYYALLMLLQELELLRIPQELSVIMAGSTLQGASEASRKVSLLVDEMQGPRIVYIQPHGDRSATTSGKGPVTISFDEFAAVVSRHPDHLSERFARSLQEWAAVQAGDGPQADDTPDV